MSRYNQKQGFTLISLALAVLIVCISLYAFLFLSSQNSKIMANVERLAIAENFASELLEFFRSYSDDELKAYLEKNPADPALPPYFLCSQINMLDRAKGVVVNRDDVASLPPSLLDGSTPETKANRWYQIWILDIHTLQPPTTLLSGVALTSGGCSNTALDFYFADRKPASKTEVIQLDPSDKLMITVGVSWIPPGGSLSDVKRVAMSTVLPDLHQ